jgi:hypothetical protein
MSSDLRLGNQHRLTRVAVCTGHQADTAGVVEADREMAKVLGIEDRGKDYKTLCSPFRIGLVLRAVGRHARV